MTQNTGGKRSPLFLIFLTVFIDMLGVGIIIPVIPVIFFDPTSSFFAVEVSNTYRSVAYGFLIACFPFMQFFGAPLLGTISDRFGRKPILSMSLVGTMIGYLLFAYAILQQNLILLFISRMIPGFMGGNIAIILSSIADISDEESKTKNFGLVGMAFGLGFILGPTIGGILADETVYSGFSHATPFWFTAILTLLNLIFVQFAFPETLKESRVASITLLKGFQNIALSFKVPKLRYIFMVVLLLSLGFSFFTQFFSVYLIQEFSYSEKNIGLLYGWIGLWLAFTQGVIVRKLSNRFKSTQLLSVTILGLSLALLVLLVPSEAVWFYILNPFVAIFQGTTSPNMTSLISSQAGPERQGEILGINQSMNSLGQMIPPLIAGYINAIDTSLPLIAAAGLTFLGWIIFMVLARR
ncbi:MAG: MFS transporter [Saprospiraceae bacterium]|nr:MFS transporter [Saprospiraceae bacterium]